MWQQPAQTTVNPLMRMLTFCQIIRKLFNSVISKFYKTAIVMSLIY